MTMKKVLFFILVLLCFQGLAKEPKTSFKTAGYKVYWEKEFQTSMPLDSIKKNILLSHGNFVELHESTDALRLHFSEKNPARDYPKLMWSFFDSPLIFFATITFSPGSYKVVVDGIVASRLTDKYDWATGEQLTPQKTSVEEKFTVPNNIKGKAYLRETQELRVFDQYLTDLFAVKLDNNRKW